MPNASRKSKNNTKLHQKGKQDLNNESKDLKNTSIVS
jgi:hypothetical protein